MPQMNEPPIDPPDEWFGDDERPEMDDDREPEPRLDEWDIQDWQDGGVEW